jgi:glycosyltransferase involved in cell wall biosynthesis
MDSLKTILYVLPANAIGGAEVKFFHVIKHIQGARSILLTHLPVAGYFAALGITIYNFEDYGCFEPMPFSVLRTVKYAKAIAETCRQEAVDCVVGIMHTGSFYSSVARDFFRIRMPHIGTIEGNISAFFSREKRKPTILERLILWYLLRSPSLIFVPSEGVRDDLIRNFRADERKVKLIYNGIDINHVRSLADESPDSRTGYSGKIILTACRLNAQKDFVTLLRAFREVREQIESRLVIVGDGELRGEIVRYAREIGVEKDLVITGFQQNPYRLMKNADIFILSSFFEGFGNVIVEAMALGVPVVATDAPSGPAEIIQDQVNGLLVPVQDHGTMANAVIKLLLDKALREKIVANGMERAELFKVEYMAEKMGTLLVTSIRNNCGRI